MGVSLKKLEALRTLLLESGSRKMGGCGKKCVEITESCVEICVVWTPKHLLLLFFSHLLQKK
jgi:hypothetical protein